jgi:hypothetical protein
MGYMARNQYGDVRFLDKHPRKELLEYYGRQHAERIYIDDKQGDVWHIGYVVAGQWFTVYGLEGVTFRKKVSF